MDFYNKAILPKGFKANGLWCGLKRSGRPDVALLYSEAPAAAYGKFTTNLIQAAPVVVTKEHLRRARDHRSIIVNSGNANCFTGEPGMKDARAMSESVAQCLGILPSQVLVASTGIIGKRLDVGKIKAAVPRLVSGLSGKGISGASTAIMTTDTFVKEATAQFLVKGKRLTVCGIAKGAGMIAPNMATLLAFFLTDARINRSALKRAFDRAIENSFNLITVDGCMSTNDAALILANGASESPLMDAGSSFDDFEAALTAVSRALARMIVEDAEGASKFIEIRVVRARTTGDAKKAALAVANSNLFKTAVYGENPNFGRVVAAVGASGVRVSEKKLRVRMGPLHKKNITVEVDLAAGKAGCSVYTSDLTPQYIKINAEYS